MEARSSQDIVGPCGTLGICAYDMPDWWGGLEAGLEKKCGNKRINVEG